MRGSMLHEAIYNSSLLLREEMSPVSLCRLKQERRKMEIRLKVVIQTLQDNTPKFWDSAKLKG